MVTQYGKCDRSRVPPSNFTEIPFLDVELYQRIEHLLGKKLPLFKTEEDEVLALSERVGEAQRTARLELKDIEDKRGNKTKFKNFEDDDTEQFNGARKRIGRVDERNGGGRGGKRKKFKS